VQNPAYRRRRSERTQYVERWRVIVGRCGSCGLGWRRRIIGARCVALRGILETVDFAASGSVLTFALGRDVAGGPKAVDLAKMPHLLIAGATGSGKSVCINTIITSLLYRYPPQELRLLMIAAATPHSLSILMPWPS